MFSLPTEKTHLIVIKEDGAFRYKQDSFEDIERTERWIRNNKFGMLVQLNNENSNELFGQQKYVALAMLDPNSPKFDAQIQSLKSAATDAKSKFKSRLQLAWLDVSKWWRYAEHTFSVTKDRIPSTIIVHPNGEEFFDQTADGAPIKVAGVEVVAAVADAMDGRLKSKRLNGFLGSIFGALGAITGLITDHPFIIMLSATALFIVYYVTMRSASDGLSLHPAKAD
jgi:hypothetical protein